MRFRLTSIANLSIVLEPFLPFTANKLKNMLALPDNLGWNDAGKPFVETDHLINKAELLLKVVFLSLKLNLNLQNRLWTLLKDLTITVGR